MHPNHLPNVVVLYDGEFGKRVAERLANLEKVDLMSLLAVKSDLPTALKGYDFICVTSWRPHQALYKKIDDYCHQHDISWSLADISGDLLRCGPLVMPGKGACYHCFEKRLTSHSKSVERDNIIDATFERNENFGIDGFVTPMVEIAATSLAEDTHGEAWQAGRFRLVDVVNSSVRRSEVIGIHNCPRCRPKAENVKQSDRFVSTMVPELEGILE